MEGAGQIQQQGLARLCLPPQRRFERCLWHLIKSIHAHLTARCHMAVHCTSPRPSINVPRAPHRSSCSRSRRGTREGRVAAVRTMPVGRFLRMLKPVKARQTGQCTRT